MADEIQDAIADSATGPRRVRGDEGEMEQHPLPHMIEADRYLRAKKVNPRQVLRGLLSRAVPPGPV